jgi:hypothetical protein
MSRLIRRASIDGVGMRRVVRNCVPGGSASTAGDAEGD